MVGGAHPRRSRVGSFFRIDRCIYNHCLNEGLSMRQVAEHTALGNLVWALRRKIRIPGSAKLPPVFARRFSL